MISHYFRQGLRAILMLGKVFVVIILVVHLLPIFTQAFHFVQYAASHMMGFVSQLFSFLS